MKFCEMSSISVLWKDVMPWKLFLNFQSNNEIAGMRVKRIENLTGNFYLTADFASASRAGVTYA